MKRLIYLFLLVFLISCDKEDHSGVIETSLLTSLTGDSGLSYNESKDKWNVLKSKHGKSYIYQTSVTSWSGYSYITEIKVIDDIVTSRIYQEFRVDNTNGNKEVIDSYNESINDLGSHEEGAAPLTIDELYNICASEYLVIDEENNTLYFKTELNGLMTLCGFVPDGCMDDCFKGISINSFDWVK